MQIGQKVQAYVTLMRLPYIFVLDVLCVLFITTFHKGFYEPELTVLAVITVTLVTAGSAAINDYYDRDSDVITHPERPIPAQTISSVRAAKFSAITLLAGLGVSFAINTIAFGIVALNVVLFILYPRVIKRLSGFLSNLFMGYLAATIALFAGAVVFHAINVVSLSFVGLIAGAAIGLNVLKDILTLEGDLKIGYPTLAATHNVHVAAVVGTLFLLFSGITAPVPFFAGAVGVAYLFSVAVWGAVVTVTAFSLLRTRDLADVTKHVKTFTQLFPWLAAVACSAYAVPAVLWGIS